MAKLFKTVSELGAVCRAFRAGYFAGAMDDQLFEPDEESANVAFDKWVDKGYPQPNVAAKK